MNRRRKKRRKRTGKEMRVVEEEEKEGKECRNEGEKESLLEKKKRIDERDEKYTRKELK